MEKQGRPSSRERPGSRESPGSRERPAEEAAAAAVPAIADRRGGGDAVGDGARGGAADTGAGVGIIDEADAQQLAIQEGAGVASFLASGSAPQADGRSSGVVEFMEFVRSLGIDPVKDNEMLWIAEEAFNAPVPPGWTEHTDEHGNTYFHCLATEESVWDNPMDALYAEIVDYHRQVTREGGFWNIDADLDRKHEQIQLGLQEWVELHDEEGNRFYYHKTTQESRYDDPRKSVYHELYARIRLVNKLKERLPLLAMAPRPDQATPYEMELARFQESEEERFEAAAVRIQACVRAINARRLARQVKARSIVGRGHQPLRSRVQLKMKIVGMDGRKELVLAETTPHRRSKAASKIQARMRGVLTRASLKPMLEHRRFLDRNAARIQRVARVFVSVRLAEKREQERREAAAMNCQRLVRGFLARRYVERFRVERKKFLHYQECVIMLQCMVRCKIARNELAKRMHAKFSAHVTSVQAVARRFIAVGQLARLRVDAVPVPCISKSDTLAPRDKFNRNEGACRGGRVPPDPPQRSARLGHVPPLDKKGNVAAAKLRGHRLDAGPCPCIFQRDILAGHERCYLPWSRGLYVLRVDRDSKVLGPRRAPMNIFGRACFANVDSVAATMITSLVRMFLQRQRYKKRLADKAKFEQMEREAKKQFHRLQVRSAIYIQKIFRGHSVRKKNILGQKILKKRQKQDKAATKIQAAWRGWLARRHVEVMTEHLIWPVRGWFNYTSTGRDCAQVEVQFFPNPRFDGFRYFQQHGSMEELYEALGNMHKEVTFCANRLGYDAPDAPEPPPSLTRRQSAASSGGGRKRGSKGASGTTPTADKRSAKGPSPAPSPVAATGAHPDAGGGVSSSPSLQRTIKPSELGGGTPAGKDALAASGVAGGAAGGTASLSSSLAGAATPAAGSLAGPTTPAAGGGGAAPAAGGGGGQKGAGRNTRVAPGTEVGADSTGAEAARGGAGGGQSAQPVTSPAGPPRRNSGQLGATGPTPVPPPAAATPVSSGIAADANGKAVPVPAPDPAGGHAEGGGAPDAPDVLPREAEEFGDTSGAEGELAEAAETLRQPEPEPDDPMADGRALKVLKQASLTHSGTGSHYAGKWVNGQFVRNSADSIDALTEAQRSQLTADMERRRREKVAELVRRQKKHAAKRRKEQKREVSKFQERGLGLEMFHEENPSKAKTMELQRWLKKKEMEEDERRASEEGLDPRLVAAERLERERAAQRERSMRGADKRRQHALASSGMPVGDPRAMRSHPGAFGASPGPGPQRIVHRHVHHHMHHPDGSSEEVQSPTDPRASWHGFPGQAAADPRADYHGFPGHPAMGFDTGASGHGELRLPSLGATSVDPNAQTQSSGFWGGSMMGSAPPGAMGGSAGPSCRSMGDLRRRPGPQAPVFTNGSPNSRFAADGPAYAPSKDVVTMKVRPLVHSFSEGNTRRGVLPGVKQIKGGLPSGGAYVPFPEPLTLGGGGRSRASGVPDPIMTG